jgi:ssDNA-binding replication factor A large subunit
MKVSELAPNSKVTNLVVNIDKLEEKTQTNGTDLQEGIVSDSTGQVKITLWGEHVGKFEEGTKIIMVTGWCKEFEGTLQISTGKFGKIELAPKEKP